MSLKMSWQENSLVQSEASDTTQATFNRTFLIRGLGKPDHEAA